jgi:hypothetical protein
MEKEKLINELEHIRESIWDFKPKGDIKKPNVFHFCNVDATLGTLIYKLKTE